MAVLLICSSLNGKVTSSNKCRSRVSVKLVRSSYVVILFDICSGIPEILAVKNGVLVLVN